MNNNKKSRGPSARETFLATNAIEAVGAEHTYKRYQVAPYRVGQVVCTLEAYGHMKFVALDPDTEGGMYVTNNAGVTLTMTIDEPHVIYHTTHTGGNAQ